MKKAKSIPIAVKLLFFIILMLAGESILLGCTIFGGGIFRYMRTNETNVFHERIVNRKNYLEEEMRNRWSDVEDSVYRINSITQKLLEEGKISLDTLDNSSVDSLPLLEQAANELISMIRNNKVTGAFLVLNREDLQELSQQEIYKDKPGLYLRDYDPESGVWDRDKDLLWNYAPAEFIRNQEIALDTVWNPMFGFEEMGEYKEYLYQPYQAALVKEDRQKEDLTDLGYWGITECSCGKQKTVITYSVPLILEDGSVYGVLGVDLLVDYVKKQLPYQELVENKAGTYLLGIEKNENGAIKNAVVSGSSFVQNQDMTELYTEKGQYYVKSRGEKLYCDVEALELYNKSSPFYGQQWVLMGISRKAQLFQFSDHVISMLFNMLKITAIVGILGGVLVSLHISRPVIRLAKDVQKAKPTGGLTLEKTGIREIDQLAGALERQSARLDQIMEKFSHVINMAQIPLAVFEVDRRDETVFVTEKFFDIFGLPPVSPSELTVGRFQEILRSLDSCRESDTGMADGCETLYRIPAEREPEKKQCYIRMMINDNGNSCIGFVEDVTEQTIEKKKMEYERNHDLLTGLKNRRAFDEEMKILFLPENRERLKTAAFVMMDLDELKQINDNYGHIYGDQYIQRAAQCFAGFIPEDTVLCRLAGDEFCMFFYGYEDRAEIKAYLENLMKELKNTTVLLPGNEEFPVYLSGGVAWYPQDGTDYEKLLQQADLAMYKVKRSGKGIIGEPDMWGGVKP